MTKLNLTSTIIQDPASWDPEELDEKYKDLTQELTDELRKSLTPYLLRRTKGTVLSLPPLQEVIVPVTLSNLERKVCE
jgi:chromodomain-helicase-DNA-binding protein 4